MTGNLKVLIILILTLDILIQNGILWGIKEYIYDEHRVLYGSVQSLYCTPETNTHGMLTS